MKMMVSDVSKSEACSAKEVLDCEDVVRIVRGWCVRIGADGDLKVSCLANDKILAVIPEASNAVVIKAVRRD